MLPGRAMLLVALAPLPVRDQSAVWQPQGATAGSIYYNGGNVGIGTTNPGTTLEVNGNIRATSPVGAFTAYRNDANQTSLLINRGGAGTDQKLWEVIAGGNGDFEIRSLNDVYSLAYPALYFTRGPASGLLILHMRLRQQRDHGGANLFRCWYPFAADWRGSLSASWIRIAAR